MYAYKSAAVSSEQERPFVMGPGAERFPGPLSTYTRDFLVHFLVYSCKPAGTEKTLEQSESKSQVLEYQEFIDFFLGLKTDFSLFKIADREYLFIV